MRCKSCYYSLKHLAKLRCPECGLAFDPDDAKTYHTGPEPRVLASVFTTVIISYVVSFVVVFLVGDTKRAADVLDAALLATVATLIASPILILIAVVSDRHRRTTQDEDQ